MKALVFFNLVLVYTYLLFIWPWRTEISKSLSTKCELKQAHLLRLWWTGFHSCWKDGWGGAKSSHVLDWWLQENEIFEFFLRCSHGQNRCLRSILDMDYGGKADPPIWCSVQLFVVQHWADLRSTELWQMKCFQADGIQNPEGRCRWLKFWQRSFSESIIAYNYNFFVSVFGATVPRPGLQGGKCRLAGGGLMHQMGLMGPVADSGGRKAFRED